MKPIQKSPRTSKPVLKPVWLRVSDAAFRFGISRTRLFQLIAEGAIESRYLIQPGKKRGIRLIREASLKAYVEGVSDQRPEPEPEQIETKAEPKRGVMKK